MPTAFDVNQIADRAEGFDGFVMFQDSSGNTYTFHTLQLMRYQFRWLKQDRYDVFGNLARIRAGQNHEFEMDLVLTVDEAETGNPPVGPATLAFWIYTLETLHQPVTAIFIGKFLTKTTQSNPYVVLTCSLDIDAIGFARPQGDVVAAPVSGRILGFSSLLRTAS